MSMKGYSKSAVIMSLSFFVFASATSGSHFRSAGPAAKQTVASQKVKMSLQDSLEAMLRGGDGAIAQRQIRIEASMWQTFQSLPKNPMGRLAPRAVRYIVHQYFAKEHGWLIKGLEPHGMMSNVTEVHEINILQDKAPALVEKMLESRQMDHGLSLDDCVVMVAVLESLIFDESISLLQAAYGFNDQSTTSLIDESTLHEVLRSYLIVFEMGTRGHLSDASAHQALKSKVAATGWDGLVTFEEDTARNFVYAHRHSINPFQPQRYSFQEVSQLVEQLADGYGKWQNSECRQMKEELMDLAPDGSGRVPLSKFYSQPDTAEYQFSESAEYLRQIGALDESGSGEPRVLIANYVAGPSNCIASSTYYSVCCLSDCEGLMNDLEGTIRAPTASVERLVGVVGSLSSPSVDAPRQLPENLVAKLHQIADHHGGEIPLHGRLFAQWLHHAFPNECPYPHIAEEKAVLSPGHWKANKATVSNEERQEHVGESTGAEEVAEPYVLQWSEDEILPLHEPQVDLNMRRIRALMIDDCFGHLMRFPMQVGAMLFKRSEHKMLPLDGPQVDLNMRRIRALMIDSSLGPFLHVAMQLSAMLFVIIHMSIKGFHILQQIISPNGRAKTDKSDFALPF